MRLLLISVLLLLASFACAQEPLVLPGNLSSARMDIASYTHFYEDTSGDTLPLSVIQTKPFRPFSKKRNERATFSDRSIMVTWLRFTLRNSHSTDTLQVFHQTSVHGLISLFENTQLIGQTGISLPPQRRVSRFALSLSVPPLEQRTYYVRVIDYIWSPSAIYSTLLSIRGSYELDNLGQWQMNVQLAVVALLAGCLFFMSIYTFYSFLLSKDPAFLYYSLFVLFCFLFTLHHMDYHFSFALLFPRRVSEALGPFHVALIALFYTLFVAKLINVRTEFPLAWLLVKGLIIILGIQELQTLIEWIYGKPLFNNNNIYIFAMVPAGLTTCILLTIAYRSHTPIKPYLLIGMASLLILSFLPGSLDLYFPTLDGLTFHFINDPFIWVIAGLSLEACCFAMALAYRSRLIEVEKHRIQKNYARDLEVQLVERTQANEAQSRQLEKQHIRQVEIEYEHKLADRERMALRAQMNPHFIFNCLNSIKSYTLQNQSEQASDYLTKFSRLIRLVLENSRSDLVTLKKELEALQLYMELEAMRFKHKVRFVMQVASEVDQQYLRIPPLILQPFVENAIWHGLMHKVEGGLVSIVISQPIEQLLRIEITDNGVGRAKATQLKSKSVDKHKSFGMQVTADRLRMMNERYQMHTHTKIIDLVDSFGEACGTKVVLEIPV